MLQVKLNTLQAANNKCADQTARMRKLVCSIVVHIQQNQVFMTKAHILRCIRPLSTNLLDSLVKSPQVFSASLLESYVYLNR